MKGIFQLVCGETGVRSDLLQASELELCEILGTASADLTESEATKFFERQYVLCIYQRADELQEWDFSKFPLITVAEFVALYSGVTHEASIEQGTVLSAALGD